MVADVRRKVRKVADCKIKKSRRKYKKKSHESFPFDLVFTYFNRWR